MSKINNNKEKPSFIFLFYSYLLFIIGMKIFITNEFSYHPSPYFSKDVYEIKGGYIFLFGILLIIISSYILYKYNIIFNSYFNISSINIDANLNKYYFISIFFLYFSTTMFFITYGLLFKLFLTLSAFILVVVIILGYKINKIINKN